jgi:hypothetical protein
MKYKQLILTAMMLVAATSVSLSQIFFPSLGKFSPKGKERLDKVYSIALSSENKNVVESALIIVTKMKLDLSQETFPLISKKIEDLKSSSASPSIRYKAFLAGAIFHDSLTINQKRAFQSEDPDDFFTSLDGMLIKTSLSSK